MDISKIKTGITEPRKASWYMGKRFNEMYRSLHGLTQPSEGYNTDGFCIFEEDWDNLIILDACRYDYFKKHITLPGELESRISRGSMTREWARGNFQGENRYDTIYVTSQGWPLKVRELIDKNYRELFHYERVQDNYRAKGHLRDYCENLSSRALELQDKFPHKRLVMHYIIPHEPYVKKTGDIVLSFENKSRWQGKVEGVGHDEYTQAYDSSVQFILEHITPLVQNLEGKTVISADHGELLHERMFPIPIRRHGHPVGLYVEELLKVPWYIVDFDERKKIEPANGPSGFSDARDKDTLEELNEQLRYLGYKV